MSEGLKPCPFCGGDAELKKHEFGISPCWMVICKTCCDVSMVADTRYNAIRLWNHRTEDLKLEKQKNLLKKILTFHISKEGEIICQNCLSTEEQVCAGETCESKILTNKIRAILKED